jgi:hypothetical protein
VLVVWQDTRLEDTRRYASADKALSDPNRRYHFVLLHFTDPDSQVRALASGSAWKGRGGSEWWEYADVPWARVTAPE